MASLLNAWACRTDERDSGSTREKAKVGPEIEHSVTPLSSG